MKMPGQVAGAAGAAAPPEKATGGKVAGAKGGGDAAAGAEALGGGSGSMAAILENLKRAISQVAELVQKMGTSGGGGKSGGCGMGGGGASGVQGVQGGEATAEQFVKPLERTVTAGGQEDNAYEQRVLELINDYRTKRGLRPVTYNPMVDAAAEKHASQMARVGRMAHDGIGDGDPGERIRAEGFRKSWGENVATGQTSPEQVVAEWIASPAHLRNIVDPNFTQMGISYVTGANGRSYWAQEFGA